jgi:hypothetical protein
MSRYGVDYYVSTDAEFDGHCYTTREPAQAGVDSVHVTGRFCSAPLAIFKHDRFVTRIFGSMGRRS